MPGLKITLPVALTDTSLPLLYDDPVMSNGTMILVDASHSAGTWAAGVPANNQVVTNIAKANAKSIIGGGLVDIDVSPRFEYPIALSASQGKVARSTKGGLDMVVSVTPINVNTNPGCSFTWPDPMKTYLLNHLDDDWFISSWLQVTRAGGIAQTEAQPEFHGYSASGGATSNYLVHAQTSGDLPGSGANLAGHRGGTTATNAVGPMIRNAAVLNFSGTKPTTIATLRTRFAVAGRPADTVNSSMQTANWSPSYVFYRHYVENLTVSGRTYAQVDALDFAEYTKQVLTTGGRYFGDTFTDPTTIP